MRKNKKGGLNFKTKKVLWLPPQVHKELTQRAKKIGVASWIYVEWLIKTNE